MKIYEIKVVFLDNIPDNLEEGILYISEKYNTAIHLCACGCGGKTVTPLRPEWKNGWGLIKDGDKISLRPSIGNFTGENNYHAHYYITENKIQWL